MAKPFVLLHLPPLAIPYIENIIEKNNYHATGAILFARFIKGKKDQVNNIESLRRLLIVEVSDDDTISIYKNIFKEVSVVFLKYFSVNWIYSGRLRTQGCSSKV